MESPLAADAAKAADALTRGRWFISTDTDADGLAAAAVISTALARAGTPHTVRASRDKTLDGLRGVLDADADGYVFLDKGTFHAKDLAARCDGPVVVIDHHNLHPDGPGDAIMVNPRAVGMDGGKDACAATTAVAVALAMHPGNLDLAPIGLVGAIGDWQHVGGWQGWNKELLASSRAAKYLDERPGLSLPGGPLAGALARLKIGLDTKHAATFLSNLDIKAATADDLDDEAATRLASALVALCIEQGQDPARLAGNNLIHPRTGGTLRHAFSVADACGRLGDPGLGIAFLMGDPASRTPALARQEEYRTIIHDGLVALHDAPPNRLEHVQWARTRRAAFTGMIAGLAMEHSLPTNDLPLVMVADREDGHLQVSTRGLAPMLDAGLDLGAAVAIAAKVAGGEGGGHPIAAGAVIPADRLETFLQRLDQEVPCLD